MKDVCLKPKVNHGGRSIMVCWVLTANGVGDLVRIDGIMNAEENRQILIHRAILSVKQLIGNGFIFLLDNDPKHTALKVKSFLKQKEHSKDVQIMKWRPHSRFEYHRDFVGLFRPKISWKATKRTSVANPPKYME